MNARDPGELEEERKASGGAPHVADLKLNIYPISQRSAA
jgi:hypothetical protein